MGNALEIRVQRLPHARDLPLPVPASAGSVGLDLRAAIDGELELAPGERTLVQTGLVLAIPRGWEGQVRPRSGLAHRCGLGVINAPGTIDSDYRGEVGVLLINHGEQTVRLERGERIAQLVVAPVVQVVWQEVEEMVPAGDGEDRRRGGGFGSTGRR